MKSPAYHSIIIEEPPEPGWGLARKVEQTLVRFLQRVINSAIDTLIDILGYGWEKFLDIIEAPLVAALRPTLEEIRKQPDCPDYLKRLIDEALAGRSAAGAIVAGVFSLGMGIAGPLGVFGPFSRKIGAAIDRKVLSGLPTPAEAMAMWYRGKIPKDERDYAIKGLGYKDEYITGYEDILRPRVTDAELVALWLRKAIPEGAFVAELRRRGYTDEEIEKIKTLAWRIPPLTDIIRMAVREAFTPEVIAKYGLGARYPALLTEWAEKVGLKEEWAKRYWYAHWVLPSPTMGYEMLHRGVISRDELVDLLVYADYVPWWIDKMIEISYRPYTRVDVRRMYREGVLDEAGVFRAYKDLGYDDEKARNLTAFTIAEYGADERELTKADILGAYRDGVISRVDAKRYLEGIDYPGWVAEIYLDRVDYKRTEKEKKEIIRYIGIQYIESELTESEARAQLGRLALSGEHINRLITEWNIVKERRTDRPTVSQINTFFQLDIISEAQARELLRARGFMPRYVDWFIAWMTHIKMREAEERVEQEREEAERIARKKIKTKYELEKTQIDIEIAEKRLRIEELRMLIMEAVPEARRAELETAKEEKKLAIKDNEEEIARLRLNLRTVRSQIEAIERSAEVMREEKEKKEVRLAEIAEQLKEIPRSDEVIELLELEDEYRITIDELRAEIAKLRREIAEIDYELARIFSVEEIEAMKEEIQRIKVEIQELRKKKKELKLEVVS